MRQWHMEVWYGEKRKSEVKSRRSNQSLLGMRPEWVRGTGINMTTIQTQHMLITKDLKTKPLDYTTHFHNSLMTERSLLYEAIGTKLAKKWGQDINLWERDSEATPTHDPPKPKTHLKPPVASKTSNSYGYIFPFSFSYTYVLSSHTPIPPHTWPPSGNSSL